MTMALPLAFAACTSDEFESQGTDINLAQRTEIGQVEILANLGEAQTRWTEGFLPEVSDVFGAALIDVPGGTGKDTDAKWKREYDVTDYISSNYPYTFNGTTWTSEAKLVEGSYLFYAPYAEEHQVRSAIEYAAPVAQDLKVENGKVIENSAMADVAENSKYPFYFGYKFFDKEDDNRQLNLAMRPIFAYPKFTFKNTTGEAVTITRILVEDLKSSIPATGKFSNTAIATKMNDNKSGWYGDATSNYNKHLTTAELLIASGEDEYTKTNLVRADLSEAVTVANNEEMTFEIVMPAMKFGIGDLKVYYVTTSGKAYVKTNTTSTVELVPGRRYPAEDYEINGSLKGAAGQLLTTTVTAKDNENMENAPYIVTTKDELIAAISNTPSSLVSPLKLTIAGEEGDVIFDKEVLETIAEVMSQPIELIGTIDIIGGTEAEPLDINQKVFFDKAVVKSGYVKFNRKDDAANNNNGLNYKHVTVDKGATLVVDAVSGILGNEYEVDEKTGAISSKTNATAEIVNNGTLKINTAVESIVNNNALTLGVNATNMTMGSYTGALDTENTEVQSQTITVAAGSNLALKAQERLEGVWTIEKGATLTVNNGGNTLPYGSKLTMNGTLDGGKLTVSGTMDLNGRTDADIKVDGVYSKEDATKTQTATLNINDGFIAMGEISGNNNPANVPAQIVNINTDANSFFSNATAIANTKATYTINGDVTKADDAVVPAQANTLKITGNIAATADGINLQNEWTELTDLTVGGSIIANNGSVSFRLSSNAEVNVKDILARQAVTIDAANSTLKVTGEFNTTAVFTTNATKVELGSVTLNAGTGHFAFNQSGTTLTLKGETMLGVDLDLSAITNLTTLVMDGDITIANDKTLTLPANANNKVYGNVTISGQGSVKASGSTITVLGNSVLTNNTTITGASGDAVTFATSTDDAEGEAIEGATTGQVVNNGTINWAAAAYSKDATDETDGKGWWNGSAADTDATPGN